jgi:hypothetical protein
MFMNVTHQDVSNESSGTLGVLDATTAANYRVWASDNQIYGPVSLAMLMEWIRDGRVFSDTWIYAEAKKSWCLAETLPELGEILPADEGTAFLHHLKTDNATVDPYELRLFPVMAALSNRDLAHFIKVSELVLAVPGEYIIRRREPGDGIFFLLSGSVRAQILVGREEKTLASIDAGQFFGEIAMFTNTPRAADVIAKTDCRLLRLSTESFRHLIGENPAAAASVLYNISSTLAQRIIDTNNKFQNEVASGFVWR